MPLLQGLALAEQVQGVDVEGEVMIEPIRINDLGMRIGSGHPRAKLTDAEVDQLLADRGPDHEPAMSYMELARKWGISKASVRDIVKGRRRGQIGPSVDRPEPIRIKGKRVRVNLTMALHLRAKLHRLGGGAWLEKMLEEHQAAHR